MQAKERLSCLNDVRTTLASVLQELGLKARLRPRADGLGIIFESEDRLVCSPVTLDLSGSLGPSTEIWHRAGLTWQYYERRPASDNGWIYDKVMLGCRDYIPLAGHDIFEVLEATLRDAGVVWSQDHPLSTINENVAETYENLKIWLSEFGESSIACERARGVESLNFDDPCGKKWKIEFGRSAISVLADGKLFRRFKNEVGGIRVAGEVGAEIRILHRSLERKF